MPKKLFLGNLGLHPPQDSGSSFLFLFFAHVRFRTNSVWWLLGTTMACEFFADEGTYAALRGIDCPSLFADGSISGRDGSEPRLSQKKVR